MEIMGLIPQPKNNDKIYYTAKIPPFPQIPKSNTHHLPRQCVPKSSIHLISYLPIVSTPQRYKRYAHHP
nr:MAG TPA: hypothetical protein [Crassvirales sp.]